MIPVSRDHFKRLLALAANTPGHEDITNAYKLGEGEPSGSTLMWTSRKHDGAAVKDAIHADASCVRIRFHNLPCEPRTVRPASFTVSFLIDGKWMRSLTASNIVIPAFDYTAGDSVTTIVEFLVYENAKAWVPDDHPDTPSLDWVRTETPATNPSSKNLLHEILLGVTARIQPIAPAQHKLTLADNGILCLSLAIGGKWLDLGIPTSDLSRPYPELMQEIEGLILKSGLVTPAFTVKEKPE